VDRVVLTSGDLPHARIVEIILLCERSMVAFNMVPDLFRVMTTSMDVQQLDDIPLLGLARWPLDLFWNRVLKRLEDLVGAAVGLVVAVPVIALAAVLIKRSSPGPVFFGQERCGEQGRRFRIHKLRTMPVNAEAASGPVFAVEGDPRVTGVGAFLRRHNLDELPQLWNVLKGEMSLVGPRPERPHFVEKFKEDVGRYMWRHVSKPGMTGWAQVNGLRGNTSIEERVKYDLYYLEHWSPAFDFKILLKTLFARQNAY
jgi:exopolysaccharide biosynthesis polyprenyl glycosylphosphotransferase